MTHALFSAVGAPGSFGLALTTSIRSSARPTSSWVDGAGLFVVAWTPAPVLDGAARPRLAHRQLLVRPLLLVLHRQLETLGDDHRLHRRLDLRDAREIRLRLRRLAAGRFAELLRHGQQLAERAVLLLLVLDQIVDEVGLQDRVVGLEADVGLLAAVLLGDLPQPLAR